MVRRQIDLCRPWETRQERKEREASWLPTAIDGYLEMLLEQAGTDLHLTAGTMPQIRVDGDVRPLKGDAKLTQGDVEKLVLSILTRNLAEKLFAEKMLDFSFNWRAQARFRVSAFFQRTSLAMTMRLIPYHIPTFKELGLPEICADLAQLTSGLVLITGPTGCGKSTTLASMVSYINKRRPVHILTIEEPIEYCHPHGKGIVNQREVGEDVNSFPDALKAALREDPDVILIGEMRDLDTIKTALTIAETGHLVFATLHTNDTAQAIDRIVDVFPADEQTQIKVQLASALQAVVHQRLIPKIGGGRVAAFEVLTATNPVRNLILDGKTRQLRNIVATGVRDGMRTFEMSLNELIRGGTITYDDAIARSMHPHEVVDAHEPVGSGS